MGPLKDLITKINTQLADLTASQRLAIGLCAVVIVGSFLWLLRWSSEPEYVRLLEEPMTTDQIALARQHLPAGEYRIVGEHVWVSPSKRHELFWALQSAGALPADTSVTFAKLIEDDSPFRPAAENQFRRRIALQNELAKVFASSELVRSAEVFLADTSKRQVNAPHVTPSASVTITMVAGAVIDPEIVKACAALVAGAVPGLSPHRVSVIDGATLREYKLPDPENALASGQLQEKQKHEEHLVKKVLDQLSYIPGIRVAVSVQLDTARKQTRDFEYAEPAVAEEKTLTSETRSRGPSGESGVGPNVGQSLTTNGASGSDTTDESSTRFQDQPLTKEVTTEHLPFSVVRTTASIGVPYSYVASVARKLKGGTTDPTPKEVDDQFTTESRRIRSAVKNIVMAEADGDVTVELFPDLDPAVTLLPDGSLASSPGLAGHSPLSDLLRQYAPEGGLALLAILGLFMLSRMAKRSARDAAEMHAASLSAARRTQQAEEEVLTVASDAVGRVSPTDESLLEAREVNEDLLRTAQLTDQVVQLVNDDPHAVSEMLRRWAEATE